MAVVYGGKKCYLLALPSVDSSQGVVTWVYTPIETQKFQPQLAKLEVFSLW